MQLMMTISPHMISQMLVILKSLGDSNFRRRALLKKKIMKRYENAFKKISPLLLNHGWFGQRCCWPVPMMALTASVEINV